MARRQTGARQEASAAMAGPRLLLLMSVLALLLIGLVMVYSASSVEAIDEGSSAAAYLFNQAMYAVLGIVCAVVLWRLVPYRVWDGRIVWAVWGVAVVLLVLTAVAGTEVYGAKRWLYIGPIGMQPSEFVKVVFVLVAAHLMRCYRDGEADVRTVLVQAFLTVLLPLMFLYKTQSDLGTTLICFVAILAVMWLGEVPLRVIVGIVAVGIVFVLGSIFLTDYRSGRMVYLNPWNDGQNGYGDGYNIIRSYYAFAEGGIFGVGLGNSHEKYLYLFASESDFIFAVIGEELGMVGALAVIGLFLAFLYAGMRIARLAQDSFGTMLAGGCTFAIVFQAFLNIGCTIGVLPTTGKPLPFISSGGSSMVATFIMVGIILSVTRDETPPSVYERRREDLRVVREVRPSAAPTQAPRSRRGRSACVAGRPAAVPAATRRGACATRHPAAAARVIPFAGAIRFSRGR